MASRPKLHASGQLDSSCHQVDGRQDRRARERCSSRLLGGNAAEQESEGETEDTTTVHESSPSSLLETSNVLGGVNFHFPPFSGSSTTTLPWPDESLPSFYNSDTEEASGLEPFGPQHSRAFYTYQAQPMDIHMPTTFPIGNDEQSRDVGVMAYGTPAQTCSTDVQIYRASDEAMDLDWPNRSADTESFSPANAFSARVNRARETGTNRARISPSFDLSSTAEATLSKDLGGEKAGISFNEETSSVNKIQDRRMQRLSELAMELYAQLAANDRENNQPTSGAATTAFQDQLVGSVLKSSSTFLTLLTSFSAPATLSPALFSPPSPTSSINQDDSICSSSDSDASPSASPMHHDEPAMDEPVQHTHGKLPTGSSDDSKPPPQTDVTTVLLLLTCYLRIIHLHSIMHVRIFDYILAFLPHNTQHGDTVPPVFPGMQVGGVSLDKFGTFQIKLLLQISLHMLGEIELTLGLPEEYRVGKRKSKKKGGARGVLEASVSGGFVRCLMREQAWRGQKVQCVREGLGNLRRLLKETIDF